MPHFEILCGNLTVGYEVNLKNSQDWNWVAAEHWFDALCHFLQLLSLETPKQTHVSCLYFDRDR